MQPTYPSVIPDMPDADYRAVDAVSSTHIKTCWRFCPAVAKAQLEGLLDDDDKQELITGIAAHVAILKPDTFAGLYVLAGQCEEKTTKGTRCSRGGKVRSGGQWFCSQHFEASGLVADAITGLPEDEWNIVHGARKSLMEHPQASALLRHADETELSLFWIDSATGLRCKARVDMLCRSIAAMPDLKTCACAKPEKFLYHAWDYGYHLQLDHYWRGCAANGIDVQDAPLIACEKKPPYVVEVMNPTAKFMEEGSRLRDETLAVIAACRASKVWAGYRTGISDLMTPDEAYQMKRDEKRREFAKE